MVLHQITKVAAIIRPVLHQPVGLPLVTNGPDNTNNFNYWRVRCWSQRPV